MHCPSCLLDKIKENGPTPYGKQNYRCKVCGRQFVASFTHYFSGQKLRCKEAALAENLSICGFCRVFQVSLTWLPTRPDSPLHIVSGRKSLLI
jgi:insertion element IS1 protein InsB